MIPRGDAEALVARLSDRQLACLRLVAELKKTEQIAAELGISPSTVNTHIERALVILGVRSRREAASLVIRAGDDVLEDRRSESPTELPRLSDPSPDVPSNVPAAVPGLPRRNNLDIPQRLGLAFIALVFLCLAIAGLGAAIEQLSAWRSSLASARTQHAAR